MLKKIASKMQRINILKDHGIGSVPPGQVFRAPAGITARKNLVFTKSFRRYNG